MKTIDQYVQECYQQYLESSKDDKSILFQKQLIERLKRENKQYGHAIVPENIPGGITVHFHGFPPESEFKEILRCFHRHDYFELIYIYHGNFYNQFQDQTLQLHQGDLLLLNSNVLHSVYTERKEDIVFDIMISRNLFQQSAASILKDNPLFSFFFMDSLYSNNKNQRYLYFEAGKSPEAKKLTHTIILESINQRPCKDNMMQAALMMLFAHLSRMQAETKGLPLHQQDKNFKIFEIISYMDENCTSLTLEQLAEKFHYSTSYLSKLILQTSGKHFGELIQKFKLEKSAWYLTHTPLSIGEIAKAIGFQDEAYFYRLFKKHYGITPKSYRNQSIAY